MKIGILYICTGKYKIFWKDFYLTCEKNFITEAEKHYFVFTDSPEIDFENDNKNIHRIYQANLGWPDNTLMRFEMFSRVMDKLLGFDYIFFFNADLICLDKIIATDFLPAGNDNLVATLHPGYFKAKRNEFPFEIRESSTAYIAKNSGRHYFAGGLNGGKTKDFLQAITKMKENIEIDRKNNIVAVWHDESHWNKYLENREDIKILDPGFLYPESVIIPFKKIIMIRDKRKYFNYKEIGKNTEAQDIGLLQKIKEKIEKNGWIQRSTIWQILKKWLNRINLFRTIYRFDKWQAFKNYLRNDNDYVRVKKEINHYKSKGIFNFNGVKLPYSVITPDAYLNVLKPHIEGIKYNSESINKFYLEQKNKYPTLTYWKDNYLSRVPDYIGSHIICHGFTYFFREIDVNKGDVVIDLGAAPGDFSAVCINKGASRVYAFEPEENNSSNLSVVSKLNENKIEIIRKYCGTETNIENNSISLDDFAKENNLTKIDFIKADIEGAEANAIMGAKNILKKYKPKLSFCTYHSIDDEKNIIKAILDGNPDYKIYKEKGIVYAY
ncbi:MAG: family 6 glucosyltransferase [Minisyncoccia bacterium]